MKTKFPKQKQELKELAAKIRELKSQRKTSPYGYVSGLFSAQYEYRNKHIVYCLAHGTPYERIEQPERADNINLENLMNQAEKLVEERDEALRNSMQEAV